MALIRVQALVLRNMRMGDTSRIVSVLSREMGKWSGVAKGVRDPKGRFGAALEILNISSLIVYFRSGRDLQLISEGSLEREFRGILKDSRSYHHGCAVLEFLDRVLEDEAPLPEVYDLAVRVLSLMEQSPRGRLAYLLRAFQLRTIVWLGYTPGLSSCHGCGGGDLRFFSVPDGTALCASCRQGSSGALPIGSETLSVLRSILRGSLPRQPSVACGHEIEAIVESFLTYHIDRYQGLRSLKGLAQIGRLKPARS